MSVDLFDVAAERLEHHASLDRLAARGTLRIALKVAGLTAKSVTAKQLCVVFEKVMPEELKLRGVSNTVVACNKVINDLMNSPAPSETAPETEIDAIFDRLANA